MSKRRVEKERKGFWGRNFFWCVRGLWVLGRNGNSTREWTTPGKTVKVEKEGLELSRPVPRGGRHHFKGHLEKK